MIHSDFIIKGNKEREALTNLNETLKVYNKVLHRFHEELMKVRRTVQYRVTQVVADLGWVGLTLFWFVSTSFPVAHPILPKSHLPRQNLKPNKQ